MELQLTPDVIRVISAGLQSLNDGGPEDRKAMYACEKLLASRGYFVEGGELFPIDMIRYGYIPMYAHGSTESVFVMKDSSGHFVSPKVAGPTKYDLFFDERRTILVKAVIVYPYPGSTSQG